MIAQALSGHAAPSGPAIMSHKVTDNKKKIGFVGKYLFLSSFNRLETYTGEIILPCILLI